MNREIKFRAWDSTRKFMCPVANVVNEHHCSVRNPRHGFEEWEGGDIYVMQYTGLKDKNGKEIYEGDIVEMYEEDSRGGDEHTYRGSVTYWEGGFWLFENNEVWVDSQVDWSNPQNEDFRKVIGNIYENPELLTVEQKP